MQIGQVSKKYDYIIEFIQFCVMDVCIIVSWRACYITGMWLSFEKIWNLYHVD